MTSQEIKSLDLDKKIEYFRNILTDLDNDNEKDILNVFRLVNSYNTFDDDFFAHEDSYISDITEFIDIKMSLETEINELYKILVTYYLSMLMSCDIKPDVSDSEKVKLPTLVYGFFVSATIPLMSSIMKSIDMSEIDMNELYNIDGAFILIAKMFQSHSFVNSFLELC